MGNSLACSHLDARFVISIKCCLMARWLSVFSCPPAVRKVSEGREWGTDGSEHTPDDAFKLLLLIRKGGPSDVVSGVGVAV